MHQYWHELRALEHGVDVGACVLRGVPIARLLYRAFISVLCVARFLFEPTTSCVVVAPLLAA